MTPLVALIAALAVYRLTLIVTADKLTEPIRDRIVHRLEHIAHRPEWSKVAASGEWTAWACVCGEEWSAHGFDASGRATWQTHTETAPRHRDSRLAYWLGCAWCASAAIAVPVLWTAWLWGDRAWWFVPAAALAASGFTGALSTAASPE